MSTISPDQGLSISACGLLSLPEPIVLEILKYVDTNGLCASAQTCRALFLLAGRPLLWQRCAYYRDRSEDLLSLAARLCLSRALHLPPQVFFVHDEMDRSLRFPVEVQMFNLRRLLCSPHVDEFANKATAAIMNQIRRANRRRAQNPDASLWPADIFLLVRSDRYSLRFALRASTAAHAILLDLHQYLWPTPACAADSRAGSTSIDGKVQGNPTKAKIGIPAINTDHMWTFYDTYCPKPSSGIDDEVVKPKIIMVARIQDLKDVVATQASLEKAAAQLVALLGWSNTGLHNAYDNLERWLGPVEELCPHAGSKDVDLLLHLRRIEKVTDPARISSKFSVKDAAETTAPAIVRALTAHTKACKQQLLPSATTDWPNSLDLVVAQLSKKQHEGDPLQDPGHASLLGTASSHQVHAGQLVQGQDRPDEALSPQLRLRARLHLEALKVLQWCSLVINDHGY